MRRLILTIFLYTCSLFAWGQDAKFWHWKDLEKDGVHGVSLFKAQQLLLDLKLKPTPIIIAVLDGGIDTAHPQIKPLLWNNPKEIPGNALDDDKSRLQMKLFLRMKMRINYPLLKWQEMQSLRWVLF